jgi:hypothetical protein
LVYAPPVAHVRGVRHLINGVDNASIQKSAVPASTIDRHKRLVITFTYFEVYIKVHLSTPQPPFGGGALESPCFLRLI